MAQIDSPDELFDRGLQTVNALASSDFSCQSERSTQPLSIVNFDLDIYFILVRFLMDEDRLKMNNIKIWPLMELATENFDDLI